MIKKLQRKFIISAMAAVTIVLAIIMIIVNCVNYVNIRKSANNLLNILEDNNGVFPKLYDNIFENSEKNNSDHINDRDKDIYNNGGSRPPEMDISKETPFQIRYFTVELNGNGNIYRIDTGKIAAISTETAKEYAFELYKNGNKEGIKDCYIYRAVKVGNNTMYIFLNVENDLNNFRTFLWTSVAVSFVGIVFVLILIVIFSKRIVSPIAQSYEKQKVFITDASHEIKTPLAVIEADTEVIEIEGGESQWTKSIKEQVGKLSELTEKLVFLAKMDEEKNTFEMREISLSETVAEVAEGFKALAKAQEKKYDIDVNEKVSINADEKAIRQLLSILIENAFKYSDEAGNIVVSLKQSGKSKEVIVKNTAENLKKGDLNILFERFYRLDSSRNSDTGGSGIGLSVAKAIVEAHKGKIKAYSRDGKEMIVKIIFE